MAIHIAYGGARGVSCNRFKTSGLGHARTHLPHRAVAAGALRSRRIPPGRLCGAHAMAPEGAEDLWSIEPHAGDLSCTWTPAVTLFWGEARLHARKHPRALAGDVEPAFCWEHRRDDAPCDPVVVCCNLVGPDARSHRGVLACRLLLPGYAEHGQAPAASGGLLGGGLRLRGGLLEKVDQTLAGVREEFVQHGATGRKPAGKLLRLSSRLVEPRRHECHAVGHIEESFEEGR
mmetsp:Transcript_27602/g.81154  ORF Transcript_27602/g.81154 Transcript_27602/m.81154 type:complete len:232 (-) Transcript_27602:774-1469(-)